MVQPMQVQLSWWSLVGAIPYVIEIAKNPYAQVTLHRLGRQLPLPSVRRMVAAVALTVVLLLGTASSISAQTRGGGSGSSRGSRGQSSGNRQNPAQIPIIAGNFAGTLSSMEKKRLRVNVTEDEVVEFVRDRKTKFLRGDQEVPAKDVPVGSTVSVEATKEVSGDLVALKVIVTPTAKSQTANTPPAKSNQP